TNATVFGQPVTLTATVTSAVGTPTGAVLFTADGAILGTAAVQNGVATLVVSTITPGTHNIGASFLGTGIFADSASSAVSHDVARGMTASSIHSNRADSAFGDTIVFTVAVMPQAPASGHPSGSVTFYSGSASIGTALLDNGTATLRTYALHAGTQ